MAAVGPRFLTRFACLAERCEDTCCGDWRIAVDETHYHKLKVLLSAPDDAARFSAAICPTGTEQPFARIVHGADGFCPFLEEKLCSLHRRFGPEVLGNACASYPRMGSELAGSLEASAELSCPETARLCLLAADAMEPVAVEPELAGRGTRPQILSIDAQVAEPWLRHFVEVRRMLRRLLGERKFPVASRLFFVAWLADRLNQLYRRDSKIVDPARLAAEWQLCDQPSTLDQLHEKFSGAAVGESIAATILVVILSARLESPAPPAFRRLVESVVGADLHASGAAPSGNASADLTALGPKRLFALHRARVAALDPARVARVDQYLENYCQHHFYTDWYLRSPTLMVHVQSLLVRVAAIRWLLLGNPLVRSNGPDEAALDRAAVEAVYTFARTIEHNQALSEDITRAIERTGTLTLSHSVSLLKF